MDERVLRTVTRTSGANAALKDGSVATPGLRFAFEEVSPLPAAFRRMVRDLEFDVSEMALTTYLVAKERGVAFTALPVFLVRGFHHGAIQVVEGSGIRGPKDLEGRRVGVNRGYTVTTGVWARAVLAEEHGVDLGAVTWVLSGDEHVREYVPPANVVSAPQGRSLEDLLRAGDLAAVVGADLQAPDVVPLLPDPFEAGVAALRTRGLYPINHLVVVKDELLEAHSGLATQVFDAFARAKQVYVDLLRAGHVQDGDRTYARVLAETGHDPLPYGLEPNRRVLEQLLGAAAEQRILTRRPALEELFAAETLDRTA